MAIVTQPSAEVQLANDLLRTFGLPFRKPMHQQVDDAAAQERHAHLREARHHAYALRAAHDDVRARLDRLGVELSWDISEQLTKAAANGYRNGRLVAEFRDLGQE